MEDERCDRIYFEKITGTKSNRPEFQKLLQEIQTGDTLVITKLDRFARSTQDALNTIKFLFEKGVKINVLNLGIIENTSTGRLIFTVLLQSSKMNNTSLTLAIVYAGIPNSIFISVQTENPKRVPSFRFFLYNPRMASMPLIVVEAVRKLR